VITIINKIFNEKKAQAAMEFLTTYGWAILILIIVVVALANLGVFRAPTTPNTCSVGAPFACADIIVHTDASDRTTTTQSNITIIANNVASATFGTLEGIGGTCTAIDTSRTPFNGNGPMQIILVCPAGNAGQRETGQFDITYTLVGSSTSHTTTLRYAATREP